MSALQVHSYPRADAMVLRPVGDLTLAGCPALQDELLMFATQEPLAIVVDLDCMRARTAAVLMVFPAVAMRIREWPGVPVVLAVSRQPLRALVDTSVVPGFIPTYHSVSEALEGLEGPAPRRSRQLPLSSDIDCGRRARRGVEEICGEWGISEITASAKQVACELAENALRHARSEEWLRLELRGGVFSIAVADSDPSPPRLRPPHERRDGGRGLVLVAELSEAWGYVPRAQGGKVVWAVLAVPGR